MLNRWMLTIASLSILLLFAGAPIHAQGLFEYHKQTGAIRDNLPTLKSKSAKSPGTKRSLASPGDPDSSTTPLPSVLAVKEDGAFLYARQDEQSDTIAQLKQGQKVVPLGKAIGNGKSWYMVKTDAGVVGWAPASAVEEQGKPEPPRTNEASR